MSVSGQLSLAPSSLPKHLLSANLKHLVGSKQARNAKSHSGSKTMLSTGFAQNWKKHNLNRITKRVANIARSSFCRFASQLPWHATCAECLTALQDDSTEGARLQTKASAREVSPKAMIWTRVPCPMSVKPVNSCKFSIFKYLNMIFRCIWMCHLHVCSNCALQRANAILKNVAWACKRMSVTLRSHFAANSGLSALKMQTSADLSLENLQKRLWTYIGGVSQSAGMATFCKLRIASCQGRLQKLNTYQNYQPGKQIDWNNMEENANAIGKVTILAANSRIEIRKYFWYPLFD